MSNTPNAEREQFTISLEDADAKRLALTGGKGANLARLLDTDIPIPPGFCVTTAAYRVLVDMSEIRTAVGSLDTLEPEDTEAIAEISAEIRSKIQQRDLSDAAQRSVVTALDELGADVYAVRSSATAEDLPTASFAGQHESFLGITEQRAVLDRIRDCMASLFTDRAVSYRLRNDISHNDVAMAVVVQEMVDPEAAGVLFTADPMSGNRHVASIDANYGVGDTVVAGDVSPDNARVDRRTSGILDYEIGDKSHALRTDTDGDGTETVDLPPEKRGARVLSDGELRELVELGERVEELFGEPQDIEWALVDDDFILLQSRPITSLFPLPSPTPDDDLHVYISFGHQQAMAEALPPLVVDWWREIQNKSVEQFRSQDTAEQFSVEAGHRVYLNLTPLLRIDPLRKALLRSLGSLSQPAANALEELLDGPGESILTGTSIDGLKTLVRGISRDILFSVAPKVIVRFIRSFVRGPPNPERVRVWGETKGEQMAERIRRPASRAERVRVAFEEIEPVSVVVEIASESMIALFAGSIAGTILERLYPDAESELDALGKGFENEIATQINQRVGDLADIARQHPAVTEALDDGTSLMEIERINGGEDFVAAFEAFLDDFGHRTGSEIDLSRPRWKDDPATLLRMIWSTIAGSDPGEHRTHLDQLKRNAEEVAADLEARADRGMLGPVKKAAVRRLIRTYRGGIQLREHHKHGAAHVFAATHDVLSEAGKSLAANGQLKQPDDVWYLRKDELLAILEDDAPLDVNIDERRRIHSRYAPLTAPPLLTSDGGPPMATEDIERSENVLVGTPASSGTVEGPARVVHDPSDGSLEKDEILVAPSTDVGWTPFFQNAAGLVMEVGGQMTHGALVAREYGIPAVVSISNATTEIRTGERIRIDGVRGTVERLDRVEQPTSVKDTNAENGT